ncbi:helix-turn-helix domain-containing protein [Metabacillus indicus]|uniref:helix-turn-helix domain-containing protein n=1 Tax=Metabacillus indicus TaxID=246786 RepID=UPI002A072E90|nr:helix-turn-helix domain-containing protein [Metabacillus indicus]MDX8290913.1 helix-turn-helix domain-containing protein [Metabacillus indicus]
MLEGKIIKFYREFYNIKQRDLGEAICSATHISKIERGLTEVSKETIQLLCERLGISIDSEIENYYKIKKLLNEWHEAIIHKSHSKTEAVKEQLENSRLLQIQDFHRTYTLILARYYLSSSKNEEAEALLNEMRLWTGLSPYEQNLLLHIQGNYHLRARHDYFKAIAVLKEINLAEYSNREYYYDLALAYHSIHSNVLAYFYAGKALQFFTENRSLSRIIETEMLMLIQLEQSDDAVFQNKEYERLIEMAGDYGLSHQQALLHHNFGYHQLRQGEFTAAAEYYKKSADKRQPGDPNYLGSFEGYVNALSKEGLTKKEDLAALAQKGLSLAEKDDNKTFIHFFTMHLLKINGEVESYYQYIENHAYPHFKELGYVLPAQHYGLLLFDYYMEKGDLKKANDFAKGLMEKFRRNNQFV